MWTVIGTPVGELRLVAEGEALTAIEFEPFAADEPGGRDDEHPVLLQAARQLVEYFEGDRQEFDLPLDPRGTEFQHQVWEQLRGIAYGETASYGDVAARLGRTNAASRAVGLANGRNPIPIVVPCHRVVGANGTLTGYAGGLERKQILLDLEQGALF